MSVVDRRCIRCLTCKNVLGRNAGDSGFTNFLRTVCGLEGIKESPRLAGKVPGGFIDTQVVLSRN